MHFTVRNFGQAEEYCSYKGVNYKGVCDIGVPLLRDVINSKPFHSQVS